MVTVRSKADKNIITEMTEAMYHIVKDQFDLIESWVETPDLKDKSDQAVKKKVVGVVVTETVTEFIHPNDEFVVSVIDTEDLSQEYERLSGKPADKRWKDQRIEAEIEKLKSTK